MGKSGGSLYSKKDNTSKSPDVGAQLKCFQKSKKIDMAENERAEQKMTESKDRELYTVSRV